MQLPQIRTTCLMIRDVYLFIWSGWRINKSFSCKYNKNPQTHKQCPYLSKDGIFFVAVWYFLFERCIIWKFLKSTSPSVNLPEVGSNLISQHLSKWENQISAVTVPHCVNNSWSGFTQHPANEPFISLVWSFVWICIFLQDQHKAERSSMVSGNSLVWCLLTL